MTTFPKDSQSTDVLIIGASARAAAMSAARAGWRVWAVDLFGDDDLKQTAVQSRQMGSYRELPALIADWPRIPWLATGALENHPRLIERLATERQFWGNPADVLRNVRGPRSLFEALHKTGLPALEIWPHKSPPPPDGRWMLKPRLSAGGQGVFVWDQLSAHSPEALAVLHKPHFFQQRAEGEAVSALFLSDQKTISLIGTSRLLLANAPAPRFGYGGAIGPVTLASEVELQIAELGQAVASAFGLRGLWGMDLIQDGSRAWLVEVNPRYTATVELYEFAQGTALLPFHQSASENWKPQIVPREKLEIVSWNSKPSSCVGKIVVYADRDVAIPPWGEWNTARDPRLSELPILADRPSAGSIVPLGYPICSLFAAGETEHEARRTLNENLTAFETHFANAGLPIAVPKVSIPDVN